MSAVRPSGVKIAKIRQSTVRHTIPIRRLSRAISSRQPSNARPPLSPAHSSQHYPVHSHSHPSHPKAPSNPHQTSAPTCPTHSAYPQKSTIVSPSIPKSHDQFCTRTARHRYSAPDLDSSVTHQAPLRNETKRAHLINNPATQTAIKTRIRLRARAEGHGWIGPRALVDGVAGVRLRGLLRREGGHVACAVGDAMVEGSGKCCFEGMCVVMDGVVVEDTS